MVFSTFYRLAFTD